MYMEKGYLNAIYIYIYLFHSLYTSVLSSKENICLLESWGIGSSTPPQIPKSKNV
jgi:hypothetical protein